MRDEYDFSDAVKHPLAGKFKGKYTVTIHYNFKEKNDEGKTDKTIYNKSSINIKIYQQASAHTQE